MQSHTVAFEEGHEVELEKELFLEDAISDLPPVQKLSSYFVCFVCLSLFVYVLPLIFIFNLLLLRLRIMRDGMRCHMEESRRQIFKSSLD